MPGQEADYLQGLSGPPSILVRPNGAVSTSGISPPIGEGSATIAPDDRAGTLWSFASTAGPGLAKKCHTNETDLGRQRRETTNTPHANEAQHVLGGKTL